MKCKLFFLLVFTAVAGTAQAAPKVHAIAFGKWMPVKYFSGPDESHGVDLKVRALYVDGRLHEFTLGASHDVTDRLFVVRRVVRLNDSLPEESPAAPRWIWRPDGWLVVDRGSGRVSPLALPQFDAVASSVSWYRDYAAYCGTSDDGQKLYAMLFELGRRKPLLAKACDASKSGASACPAPRWQRLPPRVTFDMGKDQSFTYTLGEHSASIAIEGPEED